MKRVFIAATIVSTLALTGCMKSDAYHVGRCAAGQIEAKGLFVPEGFVNMAFAMTAQKTGLNAIEMKTGYDEYDGGDYSKSCKIARELEAGKR